MDMVGIVLLNWNRPKDTLACLASLEALTYQNWTAVVVDNDSNDNSIALIRDKFPEVQVIAASQNFGFSKGNNLGIEYALQEGAEFILVLNNDTIVKPDFLSLLVQAMQEQPKVGIASPKIFFHDQPDNIWYKAGEIDWDNGGAYHPNLYEYDRHEATGTYSTGYASGCAMLIPATVLQQVGGFDNRFFAVYEDVDLNLRIAALGYRIIVVPQSEILHKASVSFGGMDSPLNRYYYCRNFLLLCVKHRQYVKLRGIRIFIWRLVMRPTLKTLRGRKDYSWHYVRAVWAGLFDFVRGHFGKGPSWL